MHLIRRVATVAVAVAAMGFSPGVAVAHGNIGMIAVPDSFNYSGTYPVTVTHSQRSDGTGCLTLRGNPGSGQASLVFEGSKYNYGSFLVTNNILAVTITEPLYGQNGALMFIVPAHRGRIGQGVFENIEGGSNFDFGSLAFGAKNGC